jgi:preprotein translocase subunit SecA
MDHIDAMDTLRDGIGFRAYSGKNPVTEYQIEAGYMFEELNHLIREDTVRHVYQAKVEKAPEHVQVVKKMQEGKSARAGSNGAQQPRRAKPSEKVGRNDPCPCGSGKKYKQCCGKNQPAEE